VEKKPQNNVVKKKVI